MGPGGKLFLLDAYALIFRAYYAFINRQMHHSSGLNTSAIFGFTVTLDEILKKERPTHIAVVFDPPGPTFRHDKFEAYKANREETPEDIRKAVPYIKRIIEAFKIPVLEVQGFEADDVIGTLSRKAAGEGYEVFMMTPDKDYTQLVTDKVFMYKPRRGGNEAEILGVAEVKERYGVDDPRQVIDILALWGDSSDNIPGAPGIGEKTAKKLIAEFGSIEALYQQADKLKGKQKETLLTYIDRIRLSKELVTIDINVPVDFNADELQLSPPDKAMLRAIFSELEFRTITDRILGESNGPVGTEQQEHEQKNLFSDEQGSAAGNSPFKSIDKTDHNYKLLEDEGEIADLVRELGNKDGFCFDAETTSVNPLEAELVGLAFSFKSREAYYVPFPVEFDKAKELIRHFRKVMEDEEIRKTGQNIKYDIQVLHKYDVKVRGPLFDTMIAHYLLHPEARHNLNVLSEEYLKYRPVSIEELIGKKGQQQADMRSVPKERIKEYACEDADLTWQLAGILEKEIRESHLDKLAYELEFPLIHVLSDMEAAGFVLDTGSLEKYREVLLKDLRVLEEEIFSLAGEQFNISSPKQLGIVLFEKLKISDGSKKTKTKQYSTSEEVLSRLLDKHPVVSKILEYRRLKKLLSTYVEALPKIINSKTGKIHTSFNQAVAATGRLSSNNPNLQNIPIREERGREIRKAFVPSGSEYKLISADYSQIELRLMAHMSGDKHLIEAFNNGEDIHTATAAKIFDVEKEAVTREMRGQAKTANFGIIYGISAFGLSQRLNISRSDAKNLIEGYFNSYPDVRDYMDRCKMEAERRGYVETLLGRKRFLPDIQSRNAVVRGFAERNAINAPIQGSAADIIKIAMVNIHHLLEINGFRTSMILQVHDELIFDARQEEADDVMALVKKEMEQAYELSVPLLVEIGIGNNWFEAH